MDARPRTVQFQLALKGIGKLELDSSSVPIPFKAHFFVFSDDCFELESAMHKYFDAQRINKDREFFAITPQQAIDAHKDHFKVDIWYVDDEYAPDED